MQTHLEPQTGRKLNVAVIGNSNSAMVTSYSWAMAQRPDISLRNFSIGGVPNIILLTFLSDPTVDFPNLDFVIVELAVIEGQQLKSGSRYTTQESAQTISLFINALRAMSPARVIFLLLPITFALLEPEHFFVERHFLDCAKRHGVAVLNGYEIIRRLGGLDREGPKREFLSRARRFMAAFGLGNDSVFIMRLLGRQSPAELHRHDIGTKAFCQHAFIDPIHISRVFHGLLAEILYRWIRADPGRVQHQTSPFNTQDVVLRSYCTPRESADFAAYENRLLSRKLLRLKSGETSTFPCGNDYRAASILFNQAQTSCFLNLQSPLGNASIDLRFAAHRVNWIGAIARIPGTIGGGPICVSVSEEPLPDASLDDHPYLPTVNSPALGVAEIGELVLLRSPPCMEATGSTDEDEQPVLSIEQAEWADSIIQQTGIISAQVIAGIAEDYAVIPKRIMPHLDGIAMVNEEDVAIKARILAACFAFDHLRKTLSDGLSRLPESSILNEMKAALDQLGV